MPSAPLQVPHASANARPGRGLKSHSLLALRAFEVWNSVSGDIDEENFGFGLHPCSVIDHDRLRRWW